MVLADYHFSVSLEDTEVSSLYPYPFITYLSFLVNTVQVVTFEYNLSVSLEDTELMLFRF